MASNKSVHLLNDYYESGVYNNTEDIIEVNGEGAILWEKTINDGFTLIRDNRPYYTELYTERSVDDDQDYYKRLHECVLTECSKQLREAQLEDLFELESIDLSDENITDFGDKEYILDRLQAELNIQFNTRKQILLKTMYTYISQERKVLDENDGLSMFGTTAFHAVWEKVCADVFSNRLATPLAGLDLSNKNLEGYNPKSKLIDIIEKSEWANSEATYKATDTLIPDIISVGSSDGGDYFVILDAKYYNIQLEINKPLRGNPGIGDVTKQYLYQLAYKKFIQQNSIATVKNCFIMPTEKKQIINKGIARLPMLEALGLENIQIRQLPATRIFEYYLTMKKIEIDCLEL